MNYLPITCRTRRSGDGGRKQDDKETAADRVNDDDDFSQVMQNT